MASLYMRDAATAELVDRLAQRRDVTRTEAMRRAVQADRDRDPEHVRTPEWIEAKMADSHRRVPPIPLNGVEIDKAFRGDIVGDP